MKNMIDKLKKWLKKDNSRKRMIMIISILLIVCMILSMSYAFYVLNPKNQYDLSTTANIPSCAGANLEEGTAINLSGDNAAPISDAKALGSTNYRYAFTVSNGCSVTSSLKIAIAPSITSSMPIRAIKYALIEQTASVPTAGSYLLGDDNQKLLSDQIIKEVKENNGADVELGYEILNTTLAAGTEKHYYLYLWIDYYEGDKSQSGQMNNTTMDKTLEAYLLISDYAENEGGKVTNFLSDKVLGLVSDNEYTSSQGSSKYIVENRHGVRYAGEDPDNYVSFNGELWRIIGTFDGAEIGQNPGKYYTKIIKADVSEDGAWDNASYDNDWESSSLNGNLNLMNFTADAQNMIVDAVWHIGTPSYLDAKEEIAYYTAEEFYKAERGNTPAGAGSLLKFKAKVGLMYVSDYYYSTYSSVVGNYCQLDEMSYVSYNVYYQGCSSSAWLKNPSGYEEWTITSQSDTTSQVYSIADNGTIDYGNSSDDVGTYYYYRPTVYLSNEVEISDGIGSSADPYILEMTPTLSSTVLAQKSSSDYTSSQDGSVYKVSDQYGVRYSGKDPDNYVEFNNETWRIIGTFDGSDIGLVQGQKYTKIIKADSLTHYAWNSANTNDWENSSLRKYLNGAYYNGGEISNDWSYFFDKSYSGTDYAKGLNAASRSMIANASWHLGAYSSDGTASSWYLQEIGGLKAYNGTVLSVQSPVGIMYASDYGFAAYGSSCAIDSAKLGSYSSACAAVDWLLNPNSSNGYSALEWLINPMNTYYQTAEIDSGGNVYVALHSPNMEFVVRPTVYLESGVEITGGDGSEDSPYKLRLQTSTLSNTVLAQVGEGISSQDGSIYRVNHENVSYSGTVYDAGVRYEGKDPDNYVTFNNEKWRIIGVFEGSTIGLEPGKQYTKIIRNTRIGSYEWDYDTIENDWTNSTLNTYLNGTYLSSMTDSGKIAKYNGQYSTWHLRGTSNYSGLYSQDWYVTERYTGQAGYRGGTQYEADTETKGAIGLMYPSDYGYAAYGTSCDNNSSMTLINYEGGCAGVDWLATDSINNTDWEWLISPRPDYSGIAFYVNGNNGGYVNDDLIISVIAVRPTLYLSSDVYVTGGDGSKTNPYTLGYDEYKTISEHIQELNSTSDYTSSQDSIVYHISEYDVWGTTSVNGIRYAGSDPNNYIMFNGEEYRIIGAFEGSTIGLDSGEYYTKIIRSQSIGNRIWDDGGSTYWGYSELLAYLEGTYLSKMPKANQDLLANATWYLGTGSGDYDAAGWYSIERGTTPGAYLTGTQYLTNKSKIGLMYPSDWGYSMYDYENTTCNDTGATLDNIADIGCEGYMWLDTEVNEWLITPDYGDSGALYVGASSLSYAMYDNLYAVRPTMYLDKDVRLLSGNGSKANPYIIG